jgi:tellurite resistance protein TehA-like permease
MEGAHLIANLWRQYRGFVAGMNPALFATVMSTGIVGMAATLHGMQIIAVCRVWLNIGIYAILWTAILCRLIWFPKRLTADLKDARVAFGYFTMSAGTNILGVQVLRVLHSSESARVLWWVGVTLWCLLTYAVFFFVMANADKPHWRETLGGGWLLAVVATQTCAVLGSQVAEKSELLALVSAFWFSAGCFLYFVTIAAIFFRLTLFNLEPNQLAPPYWINMGSLATTTLAGVRIIADSPSFPGTLNTLFPFFSGFTFLFWAFATWWIPLLILLGLWKHAVTRLPMHYVPALWSMVYPIGGYTTATKLMATTFHVSAFAKISGVFVYISLAVWSLVFFGLLKTALSDVRKGLSQGDRA